MCKIVFIMIALISDAASVCDIKECSDSYKGYCHLLTMRIRRCRDYKDNYAHLLNILFSDSLIPMVAH